jgi:hypothetical protein
MVLDLDEEGASVVRRLPGIVRCKLTRLHDLGTLRTGLLRMNANLDSVPFTWGTLMIGRASTQTGMTAEEGPIASVTGMRVSNDLRVNLLTTSCAERFAVMARGFASPRAACESDIAGRVTCQCVDIHAAEDRSFVFARREALCNH